MSLTTQHGKINFRFSPRRVCMAHSFNPRAAPRLHGALTTRWPPRRPSTVRSLPPGHSAEPARQTAAAHSAVQSLRGVRSCWVRRACYARQSALLPSAAQVSRCGWLECALPCRHGRVGDVSDDDPETTGQGLCEIWGGYVGNNVSPVTCSICDGWGAPRAFYSYMTLGDVSFGPAITGPHIHQEVAACSIYDISHCHSETCHR
jgi:hypothetical protein